jgi:hypothetical protein
MSEIKIVTVRDIHTALAVKYPAPGWAYFEEVSNGTGAFHSRTADGIAISLWPSRGYEADGFEIKLSRSDFLNEMKRPQKAEAIFRFVDRWWLVTPKDLVKVEEVPKTWGLIFLKGEKLFVQKHAPGLKPKPWSRAFVASLMRDIHEQYIPKKAMDVEFTRIKNEATERAKSDMKFRLQELAKLEEDVREFEKASGIKIQDRWRHTPTQIGHAVNVVLEHGVDEQLKRIEHTRGRLAASVKDLDVAVELLRRERSGEKFDPHAEAV